ncbi:Uncharacterized protein BP5553_02277 [Venustampulla echinocandica]|uniref:Uncharacterized protein n=1 Tax=Venustampulla echinocandica TaxID=2656787 RepID=A0A370U3F1_9HELO|nr:Uncharacterized protein BP5553_02277 [Venustampulla echinocandica]RDL42298.1 Uncharacterized protein BP5553_02277 [Venustampulla echinocandica]
MAGLDSRTPLSVTKRSSHTRYSHAPKPSRQKDFDVEKHGYHEDDDDEDDDEDSDYSSDPSSPASSRDISGLYSSSRPILRRKSSAGSQRQASSYRLPSRVVRYLCLGLISTIVVFILFLIRMSVISSNKIAVGDLGERPPPPPAPWESFPFLSRYYGGIRSLVPLSENKPEYPLPADELPLSNDTSADATLPAREIPTSKPFEAYKHLTSADYLREYAPVQECFIDAKSTVPVPSVYYYSGRPSGFPDHAMGSYDILGLPEDICFERYGRLGPYGHGYGVKYGGMGTGLQGDMEGSRAVWAGKSGSGLNQIDYRKVDWADAQKKCYKANAARFDPLVPKAKLPTTFSVLDRDGTALRKRAEPGRTNATLARKTLPRTAVVIRAWDDFEYRDENILTLRSMISELSLGSGGEYDVHLLVQVKDEGKNPVWADAETYQKHLNASVPEEFRGIATLWSQTQMLMLYQGIHDTFARDLPVHGPYRGLQMAIQWFAQKHQEYEFFWHWELDIRYTGHYYNLFSQIDSWTSKQPRKGLWERSSRFYIPSVHGSWEDFKQMVRVQTEIGTKGPDDVWSGLPGAKTPPPGPKGDKPIWGPERPQDPADWFEPDSDPVPPTTYEKDKYTWGVGEEADLITFNPLFDPEGTTWLLREDVTGYNLTDGLPPRRVAIVTSSRMSRRLLNMMHRETVFKKHHAFSEMWGPTTALHHGYKAVYFPHPMFVDRVWPTAYLASVMNAGKNGATGASRTSVFGEREHNLLGMTWYYNAGFAPNLWKRWLGLKVDNSGGEEFELTADKGKDGKGANGMPGGEGRMCLPPMLIHPVKSVDMPVEKLAAEKDVQESDPSA